MPPSKVPCIGILDQNSCCASKACMLANRKEAKGENSLRHNWELGRSGIKATAGKSIPEDESQRWRRTFCNRAHALTCFSSSFVFSKHKQGCPAEKLSRTGWSALHTTQDLSFKTSICRRGVGEAVLESSRNKLCASMQQQGARETMAVTSGQAGSWFSCTLQGKSSTR